jgi:rhodanese-related sulfurtransferase
MSVDSTFPTLLSLSVQEFATRRAAMEDTGTPLQLIDVREPQELAIAQLDGFIHLPLSQFEQWSEQISTLLDPHAETIVMCHHGMRSAQMCHWLMHQGFTNVRNLTGGIDAYAIHVDPSVPQY